MTHKYFSYIAIPLLTAAGLGAAPQKAANQNTTQNTPNPQGQTATHENSSASIAHGATAHSATAMTSSRAATSLHATDMLDAVRRARTAVAHQDGFDARTHIAHALTNIDQVHRSAARAGVPAPDVVPIYAELEQYSVLGPIAMERSGGEAGTYQTPQGLVRSRTEQDGENANQQTSIQDVVSYFTAAGVSLNAARGHLEAARSAVAEGDFTTADQTLAAIEDGVMLTTVITDLPLQEARQNLLLARERSMMDDDPAGTKAALMAASEALTKYEAGETEYREDSSGLRAEIDEFAESIGDGFSEAGDQIEQWWETTTDWITMTADADSK